MPIDTLPNPGQIVFARSRQYLVDEVLSPPHPGDATLVRMSCLDDDAQGAPLEILWEHEVDARIAGPPTWHRAAERGFDSPPQFSAYLHALRWNCVTSTNPKLFQAPYRAGIEVMAYQLEPLRKALLLPRVNLFIADDVGLGKTIEAGLILQELKLRQRVRTVVVAAPPSVVQQWRDELESRFGLTFVVLDRAYVAAKRRERGFSVNPWSTHTRFIISHALLRDETYVGALRDWLGDFAHGSMLILDEAHNAAPASGAKYAIDSRFTRTIRDLAYRFEHRLFLSATPHNGHSNSFAALLELLDPQRFCRGVPVKTVKQLDAVMVRRLKEDLRQIAGGFPERMVVQHTIDDLPADAPELVLADLLARLKAVREARLESASRSVQATAGLILTSLQKRLLSSVEAFAHTLAVHRRAFARQLVQTGEPPPAPAELSLLADAPGADDDRAELGEGELRAEQEALVDAATRSTTIGPRSPLERELALIDEMARIAETARGRPDAKVDRLVSWIRANMCPELPPLGDRTEPESTPRWNDRRVIVFTEYVDTKRYLEQQLSAAISLTDRAGERIASFTGGMGEESRAAVKEAFNADPGRHPLRILLATDAAREGVNLQNHCADLFHFDVPWNPSRMEQRNGRIDRKLQRASEVHCHYFVLAQRTEDSVLEALVEKTDIIVRELGSLSPVLDRQLDSILKGGINRARVEAIKGEIRAADADASAKQTVEEELEAARQSRQNLNRQLDDLRDLLETSRDHLHLSEQGFRDALDCSLGLLGAPSLAPERIDGEATRWRFPALDRRAGADPTWADTLDTLRAPRRADQKPWEWRREAPIRPVVFTDPGTLDAEVVHLHLEQRVVQRLLGRFLAQGFVHDDLSRVCGGLTADPIPRVILLGRLSLYGDHASRLHDEIIAVAARWTDPETRTQPLRPYADETQEKTLALLEHMLGDPSLHQLPKAAAKRLLGGIERDVAELSPHLTARAEEIAKGAREKLAARGLKESAEMREILVSQRERILATSRKYDDPQLILGFDSEALRQVEADRRHWAQRLKTIEADLTREPERIRRGYEVHATRLEPVGIAYLWPVSG